MLLPCVVVTEVGDTLECWGRVPSVNDSAVGRSKEDELGSAFKGDIRGDFVGDCKISNVKGKAAIIRQLLLLFSIYNNCCSRSKLLLVLDNVLSFKY